MSCLDVFYERAQSVVKSGEGIARIVLPEGEDVRVVEGAIKAAKQSLAHITLLGNVDAITSNLEKLGGAVEDFTLIDPLKSDRHEIMLERFMQIREGKTNLEKAESAVCETLVFGALMVDLDQADGTIAGAVHTTGDTVRVAFQIIGKGEGVSSVSSFFLMGFDKKLHGRDDTIVFSDCALMIDPDAKQLADIAIASADSFNKMLGEEAKVAMLSFSTLGSAKHASVSKVEEAAMLVKATRADINIDGEMQFDAAFVESVGKSKAPDSSVAGSANVFVFPSLDAGNIGYKIAQRLGGLSATGPILQGLSKPANDLSRGCSAQDVYNMILVTANQVYAARTD